jgi:hypothetical protein
MITEADFWMPHNTLHLGVQFFNNHVLAAAFCSCHSVDRQAKMGWFQQIAINRLSEE